MNRTPDVLLPKQATCHLPNHGKLGSPGWSRTNDIRINSAALYPLSYWEMKLERPARFERATPCFVGKCSGPAELWARYWLTGMRGWNRTSLFRVAAERQATWLRAYQKIEEGLERAIGIEPIYTAWKAGASPLGQARKERYGSPGEIRTRKSPASKAGRCAVFH